MITRFLRWWKRHSLISARLQKIDKQMESSSAELCKVRNNHIDPLIKMLKETKKKPNGF